MGHLEVTVTSCNEISSRIECPSSGYVSTFELIEKVWNEFPIQVENNVSEKVVQNRSKIVRL